MNSCPRCNKQVYFTEQVVGPGGLWHKACLACYECKKKLDSTSITEKDKQVYCKTCYAKQFGPKVYGYASVSSYLPNNATPTSPSEEPTKVSPKLVTPTRTSTSSARPSLTNIGGGGDNCPKCQKKVYFAEQISGPKNTKFHKLCFKCTECKKLLSPQTFCDKDGDIFCKSCYGKQFGPKVYGFGSPASFLTTQDA